jgi:hypothetical protein
MFGQVIGQSGKKEANIGGQGPTTTQFPQKERKKDF